jgi:DNA-binding CsgD family transcriptional regulator
LWPFFARFLRQAADRPSVVHVANFSWAQGARPLPAVSRLQDGMLGGNGRLKVLVDDESAGAPDIADRLADLEGRGALVRVCRSDLPSTLILGRAAAVLRMPGPLGRPGDRSLVLIRAPEVVAAMTAMVSALWGGALDLSIFRQRVALQTGLTGRVLFLLQTGHKDETAARMLGLSVRTYRRHVATVMERLNATSRFQAGTRASSLGIRSA